MTNPPPQHNDTVPLTKGVQGWTTGKPDLITMFLLAILI